MEYIRIYLVYVFFCRFTPCTGTGAILNEGRDAD